MGDPCSPSNAGQRAGACLVRPWALTASFAVAIWCVFAFATFATATALRHELWVMQQKTHGPVQFEITLLHTSDAVQAWIRRGWLKPDNYNSYSLVAPWLTAHVHEAVRPHRNPLGRGDRARPGCVWYTFDAPI